MVGLTLITPTGARPAAFALCERYMAAQSYTGPLQWIVVDDCLPWTEVTMGQLSILPRPIWQPGMNTQSRNMLAALPHIRNEFVAVIEDDDFYHPHYLQTVYDMLTKAELVGLSKALYYNVRTRTYRQHKNVKHSSLCTTAFRREVIPTLEKVCLAGSKWIDISLWEEWRGSKTLREPGSPPLSVGVKGLPGRPGIGRGHVMDPSHGFAHDADLHVGRAWLGDCMDLYLSGAGNES